MGHRGLDRYSISRSSFSPVRRTSRFSTFLSVAAHRPSRSKRIDFILDQPTALAEFIRDGRLRALAVTSGIRFFSLPDTPTISECGFPGYAVTGWQGLVAPANLPTPILNRLHAELTDGLNDPGIVEQLRTLGNVPKS